MRTTSQTWDELYASDGGYLETKAIINGAEYTDISAPVISRAAMQDAMSVGNVISASCVLTVRTTDTIPKSAQVEIKSRLTDGETTSEWLSMGTFFISKRVRDPLNGLITLECYDALLKANATMIDTMPWTNESGVPITDDDGNIIQFAAAWPRKMNSIITDIAIVLGVEIDSRTMINNGEIYTVETPPESATIRDVLSQIAAANAGNFIITPENKLRLVNVVSAENASSAVLNVTEIRTFSGTIAVGDARAVSGVQYTWGENAEPILIGNTSGTVVNVAIPYEQASALYQTLNGMTYQPYTVTNAWYTPAAEIGDYIRYSDRFASVLWMETCSYGTTFTGDVSAPDFGEIEDEFPYIGASAKSLTDAKAFAVEKAEEAEANAIAATDALNESLNQENIFNRLTNNGEEQGIILYNGKLYINASYMRSGTMVADFIKGGTLTMGGSNNVNGSIKILDASRNVIGIWDKDGIKLYKGTIDGPSITLGGNNNADGVLTIKDSSGQTIGTWNNVGIHVDEGEISANTLKGGTINGDNVNAKLLSIVDANNNVIASFGNVITLGKSDKSHAEMRQNLFAILDEGGDVYFQAGTFESSATINETIQSTTSSQRDFYTMFNIASISSLTYNGTVVSSSNISFTGNKITLSNITLVTLGTVVVYYNTYDSVYYFNLGTRDSGSTSGFCSVAEGYNVEASGNLCHAEGRESIASADCSHAEGISTKAEGVGSHAEGYESEANGVYSHAEGQSEANGKCSHAEGGSTANYNYSHAEGTSKADELCAHAEGYDTLASNTGSHSEGFRTTASDYGSHSEGLNTVASKMGAHAEGGDTEASGNYSHAEGSYTKASGNYSHAEGYYTSASSAYQHVFGKYNVADSSGTYREIVGNGTSDSNRANIRTLYATGNEWIAGTLSQGSDARQKDECGAIPDVSSIKAHRFKWNDNKINHDDLEHIGYYAQDVEEVAPYLVSEDASGNKSLDYIGFLCAKIESLEKRVKELERK